MRSIQAGEAGNASASDPVPGAPVGGEEAADHFDVGSHRANIALAGLGFLSGAIFWHAVGFWTFLAGLMAHGPAEQTAIVANDCVTLVMERATGTTRAEPCPDLIARLPEDRRNYRGPLLTAELRRLRLPASRWEITVNSEAAADANPTEER